MDGIITGLGGEAHWSFQVRPAHGGNLYKQGWFEALCHCRKR
jgi:hypothetical protein